MATDIKAILRRALEEAEREDANESLESRLRALEERSEAGQTITVTQVIAALEQATDEELEALHGSVVDRLAREVEERREASANGSEPEPKPSPEPEPGPSRRIRPGRKQGRAYDWALDDDGNVTRIDVARVWNEPDEPDEIELPPAPEPEPRED